LEAKVSRSAERLVGIERLVLLLGSIEFNIFLDHFFHR
jgi:hypothetical protein